MVYHIRVARHVMVYQIMWSRYISRVYSSVKLETKTAQYMLPPFLGAFWLHVCSTRKRFFWTKGDLSYSQVQKSPFLKVLKANIRHLDPSRHSMEDVIKVIAITLETLLEDEENQIRYLVVLTWFPNLSTIQGTCLHCGRQRTLPGSYDFLEPDRGVTKFPVQHYL